MPNRRMVVAGGIALTLAGCGPTIRSYSGPEVTRVVIFKGEHRMFLLNGRTVLQAYDIDLGFQPRGHKKIRGDGKTPEGSYLIDRKNPGSEFHLSLGLSYPNEQDIAEAEALGIDPGGDIFIHGASGKLGQRGTDWTFGCIAVGNREIEDIYAMVNEGTQVDLFP
ncbi:MAG: L,D-transpeptidase family protein [Paracoccaceae bacterium]